MADGDLFLVSQTGDTINLNSLVTSKEGVQVVSGLTGFGLPPLEVMYQTGAGDGAKYRGKRVLPRDIDLPLHIVGLTRTSLRTHVTRLVKALAGECRLQWDDGSKLWEIKVRRVGGGEYTYGTDAHGRELNITITLRAEDPLWTAVTGTTQELVFGTTAADDQFKRITIPASELGTSDGYPTVRVYGPTLGFKIHNNDGSKRVQYLAYVPDGEWVEVNFATGQVVDKAGVNRYGNLAPGPKFFALGESLDGLFVQVDRSSTNYGSLANAPLATNRIINPDFLYNANGWTYGRDLGYFPSDPPEGLIKWDVNNQSTSFGFVSMYSAEYWRDLSWLEYNFAASEFTVGKRYQVHMYCYIGDFFQPEWTNLASIEMLQGATNNTRYYYERPFGASGTLSLDFIADDQPKRLRFYPPRQRRFDGTYNEQINAHVYRAAVVEYGFDYFDGKTADVPGGYQYNWTGTAEASKSTITTVQNAANTKAVLTYKAKNWLVI